MELQKNVGSAAKALSIVLRDAAAVRRYYIPNIKGGGVLIENPLQGASPLQGAGPLQGATLLPMGTDVLLMIALPDSQTRTAVMGKVVWVTPKDNRDGRPPAIGIQFVHDRQGIHTRIQNLLSGLAMADDDVRTF